MCARSNRREWAVQVVEDMHFEGVSLEPGLCRSLMSLYQHFNQKQDGVALYKQMKLQDIPLETPALNRWVCDGANRIAGSLIHLPGNRAVHVALARCFHGGAASIVSSCRGLLVGGVLCSEYAWGGFDLQQRPG